MSFDADALYRLLPQVYRTRDRDGALKALVRVLAEQAKVLQTDLSQLYDNHFIETCEEWAVPYLGELVGARGVMARPGMRTSRRNEVADTMRLRRRKGTAAALEQLARDITDWDVAIVEYFRRVATTQYLNHLRPDHLAYASLRDEVALEGLGSPFDTLPRTADVRRIESGRGRHNISNIGIFLWTLAAQPATRTPAFKIPAASDLRYTFDPLGRDTQLCTRPEVEETVSHLATEQNVPLPITRRRFDRKLDAYYGLTSKGKLRSILLRVDDVDVVPPLDAKGQPIGSVRNLICVCDLSDVRDDTGTVTGWAHTPQGVIAIDPVLGRIAFPSDRPAPTDVKVSYCRGFSMEMGGGEYGRAESFEAKLTPVQVAPGDSLQDALNRLKDTGGVVELTHSAYYIETPSVHIAAGMTIEVRGADQKRPLLVLSGDLTVFGGEGAAFIINGLLIVGGRIAAHRQANGTDNKLASLSVRHCTLVPGATPEIDGAPAQASQPRLIADVPALHLVVTDSISGMVRLDNECTLELRNAIVDALTPNDVAVAAIDGLAAGGALHAENSTIIGRVHVTEISLASNTIFHAQGYESDAVPVRAAQLSQGCVRFCYLPPGSITPKPYRCQPTTPEDTGRVQPVFISLDHGDAGYGQVSPRTAREIREGADDGAEMGAFHGLYIPQRLATLRARLDEFLRFGMEAGVIREN